MDERKFPVNFICAGTRYNTMDSSVAAPLFRKSFFISENTFENIESAKILMGVCGFYELYCNGKNVTKGTLAPYISNPDDLIYYDEIRLEQCLQAGKNVISIWLGNGLMNNPGGAVWDFDKAAWRGAPCFAMELTIRLKTGEMISIASDESFLTERSPILFDDYRIGEVYDAGREVPGWNLPEYDDSFWKTAESVRPPRGIPVLCTAEPVIEAGKHKAVKIIKQNNGWLFCFEKNGAGVPRLKLKGEPGQKITLHHGEVLQNGELYLKNMSCDPHMETQIDVYICKGGDEEYQPRFTYHGFQHVYAEGLKDSQVNEETVTYVELHSDLKERGGFMCSMERANRIQNAVRQSTLSNFFYFPNDCPQREKNGWTADAALSAEHTLLNLTAENSYREWMRSVRKAQTEKGSLPGIIPTGGWGIVWGNGPAWDCVLIWIPYYVYQYRGDKDFVRENSHAILSYLEYLTTRIREDGLIAFGLGDWAQVGCDDWGNYTAPLEVTDTLVAMDLCAKAEFLFREVEQEPHRRFARCLKEQLREAARKELVDEDLMVKGSCQTAQALALAVGLFEEQEKQRAFEHLLKMIEQNGRNMDVGVIGGRFLFHVLSEYGYSDLAFHMITKPDYPSYGNWIERGATTLWESFQPEGGPIDSKNHHFWGDVSHWFIRRVAGIHYGRKEGSSTLCIEPGFVRELDWAEGWHLAPEGKIAVRWERTNEKMILKLEVPSALKGVLSVDGVKQPAVSGTYYF